MFSRTTALELHSSGQTGVRVTEIGGVDGVQLPAGTILRDIERDGDLITLDLYVSSEAMLGNHPEIDLAVTVGLAASIGIELT